MKLPVRTTPLFVSALLVAALYWGLSQAESREIYAAWDKWLHASVFFLIWWLLRFSLKGAWFWISLLAVAGGGAEEIHQIWKVGHVASWADWLADLAGVAVAVAIYLVGRLLWLLQESVAEPEAKLVPAPEGRGMGIHPVDVRWTLRLWRWEYYFVFLAGHNRRALSRREQWVARVSLGFVFAVFVLFAAAVGLVVLYSINVALGVRGF